MANLSTHLFPAKVIFKWERLYHLLGRDYIYIAHHPNVEAEILSLFREINASLVEDTNLEGEYRAFLHVFINFLEACWNIQETVTLACVVRARYQNRFEYLEFVEHAIARYKNATKSAKKRASLLVHEREKLVEHDPSDIVMKFRCEWLEERLDDLMVDVAFEKNLIENLKFFVKHHEVNATRQKKKCIRLFFKLVDLESQIVQCRQNISFMENQLTSFVMLIKAQFSFTFPPQ